MEAPKEYGKPWFGQLMAGPQLLAYFIQFNYWMQNIIFLCDRKNTPVLLLCPGCFLYIMILKLFYVFLIHPAYQHCDQCPRDHSGKNVRRIMHSDIKS